MISSAQTATTTTHMKKMREDISDAPGARVREIVMPAAVTDFGSEMQRSAATAMAAEFANIATVQASSNTKTLNTKIFQHQEL